MISSRLTKWRCLVTFGELIVDYFAQTCDDRRINDYETEEVRAVVHMKIVSRSVCYDVRSNWRTNSGSVGKSFYRRSYLCRVWSHNQNWLKKKNNQNSASCSLRENCLTGKQPNEITFMEPIIAVFFCSLYWN